MPSVCRPKMKRDAGVKCCLFTIKKTAFHSSVSLHFWATNGRYGLVFEKYYPILPFSAIVTPNISSISETGTKVPRRFQKISPYTT